MYHRQQNKHYPKGVYLPISKLLSILAIANLLAHNNRSQICYCGQISLQSAAVNWQSDFFGGNIYFAGDGILNSCRHSGFEAWGKMRGILCASPDVQFALVRWKVGSETVKEFGTNPRSWKFLQQNSVSQRIARILSSL